VYDLVYFLLIFFFDLFAINLEEFYIVAKIKKDDIDLIGVEKGSKKNAIIIKKLKTQIGQKKLKIILSRFE